MTASTSPISPDWMFSNNFQKSKWQLNIKSDGRELIGFPGQDLKSSSCIFNARIEFQIVYCGIKLLTFAVYILEKVEVGYVTLPGWKASIEQIRLYDALPDNCNKQLEYIEESLKVII